MIVGVVLTLIAAVIAIHTDVKSDNGNTMYHIFRAISTVLVIMLIYFAITEAEHWKNLRWLSIVNDLSLLVFALGTFGATFGYFVRDMSTNFNQIATKTTVFEDAKVIMWLSHHLAFTSGGSVIVIPTGDLVKVVSQVQK